MVSTGWIILAISSRLAWNATLIFNWHPLLYIVGAILLDSADFPLLTNDNMGGLDNDTYQKIDKMSDAFWYISIATWLLIYKKELWYSKLFVPMLFYRLIGNFLFIITGVRELLIVFPDLFRWFFFIVTIYDMAGVDHYFKIPIVFVFSNIINVGIQVFRESIHNGPVDVTTAEILVGIFVIFWIFILGIIKRKKSFKPIWVKYKNYTKKTKSKFKQ